MKSSLEELRFTVKMHLLSETMEKEREGCASAVQVMATVCTKHVVTALGTVRFGASAELLGIVPPPGSGKELSSCLHSEEEALTCEEGPLII